MKRYLVEHMQGVAGVDEKCVERHDQVKAKDGHAAIRLVATGIDEWDERGGGSFIATIKNPESSHGSGAYNDYWMAEEITEA